MKVLVLGAGEVGAHLARVLSEHAEVVLIDRNPSALATAEDGLDVLTVLGDITHRKVLSLAGAANSALVVAVTGSDDANLVGAALAAELGTDRSVARVDDASFYKTKSSVESGVLGIHAVLCAARLVGDELIRLISAVDADHVHGFARNALQVASVRLKESHPVCSKVASALELGRGCQLAAVVRDGRPMAPVDVDRLDLGDILILSGEPLSLVEGIRDVVGAEPRRGMIVGGGDVGMQLASRLSLFEKRIQVLERDQARAEFLSEQLSRVNVIRGDGSSIATLKDEHIETVDYVAALTRSDEVNLMVSLVARDLGVTETYTLVHRPGYDEVYKHLGVRGTTGPHDVLARAVMRLMPSSQAQTSQTIPGTQLECVEFTVPASLTKSFAPHRLALSPGAFLLGRAQEGVGVVKSSEKIRASQTLVIAVPAHERRALLKQLEKIGEKS